MYVTVDKEYTVYGITVIRGYQKFMTYPNYIYHGCFKIIDSRISKYWIAKEDSDYYDSDSKIVKFGFELFLKDDNFHENLTNNVKRDVDVFKSYKELMDNKFTI